ncbi:unnamed protein product [Blepharisma stoltei]|uniref:Uncharacterized protein n=1 Tax=Blepharisma stoltei TaxID=1481888 RepID=A0AAU9I9K5_9CILI|nr:unnamed protein product [Blepharisma stoltei]
MEIVLRKHEDPQVTFCKISLQENTTITELKQKIEEKVRVNANRLKLYTYMCDVKVMIVEGWSCKFYGLENGSSVLLEMVHLREQLDTNHQELLVESYGRKRYSDANLIGKAIMIAKLGTPEELREIIEQYTASMNYTVPKGEITTFLNKPYKTGWRCIHHACKSGNVEIVKELLNWRVNLNRETDDGWTALQLACANGHFECAKLLASCPNIDVNQMSRDKGSALHLACQSGDTAIVILLLEHGASMTLEDPVGKIPLEYANKPAILEEIPKYMGEQMLKRYTIKKVRDPDMPPNFSGVINWSKPVFGTDKLVYLVLDVEEGFLYHYKSRESFLDNQEPKYSIIFDEVRDLKNLFTKGFNRSYYYFIIETAALKFKYNSYYPEVCEQWTKRIKEACDYWQRLKTKDSSPTRNPIHFIAITRETSDINESGVPKANIEPGSPVLPDSGEPKFGISDLLSEVTPQTKQYDIVEEIGVEHLGRLFKALKIDSNKIFCMKVYNKPHLQLINGVKFAMTEYRILKKTKHPFILSLHQSFQSQNHLYLVMEYCPNGTLRNHLDLRRHFDEESAKIYLAEAVLALDYLHKLDVVYRNLKPETIYLDALGHIRLTNFQLAKEDVSQANPAKSFCGAPAYMAPEILQKQSSNQALDMYSLGSLLYEMLTGMPPYYNEDTQVLFKNIKSAKLTFPSYISDGAKDLISQLMNRNPGKRPLTSQMKKMKFFEGVNWKALYSRKTRPPRLGPEWNQVDTIDESSGAKPPSRSSSGPI